MTIPISPPEPCCTLPMIRAQPDIINGGRMVFCLSCGKVHSRWQ